MSGGMLQPQEVVLRPDDGAPEQLRLRAELPLNHRPFATTTPDLCPRPALTPSNGSTSPCTGCGRGPKLKRRFFQRSPGCASRPRLAVGSYPQWTKIGRASCRERG